MASSVVDETAGTTESCFDIDGAAVLGGQNASINVIFIDVTANREFITQCNHCSPNFVFVFMLKRVFMKQAHSNINIIMPKHGDETCDTTTFAVYHFCLYLWYNGKVYCCTKVL